MNPARWPRDDPGTTRLLHVDPGTDAFLDGTIQDLRHLLRREDVLVVNDAATLPASLRATTSSGGAVEVRLVGRMPGGSWRAVLFGPGDWRTRTEDRPSPPLLGRGEVLAFEGTRASITQVDPETPRLLELTFEADEAALWSALYRAGRPVQYAHAARPLALWHVQTIYASRPWAAEAPSAGFSLTWDLLLDLRRAGIAVARVTHAAGLSSTGDAALDARLPLEESFDIPSETVSAIDRAHACGGRVVAVGTTVTRALEGAVEEGGGVLRSITSRTQLLLGPHRPLRLVDGILTGMHEGGSSHFALLQAFASRERLARARDFAEERGYSSHEFGDALLILPDAASGT